MTPDTEIAHRTLATLKRMLGEQGVSYQQLSERLNLSLATVKRMMNSDDVSLARLSQICAIVGVNPGDVLAAAALEQRPNVRALTEKEEEFFVRHPHHFGYFHELLRGRSPGTIAQRFGLSKKSTTTYLTELESHGFIKVFPGHKIKVLVPFSGAWRLNGPLARLHMRGLLERVTERQQIRREEESLASSSIREAANFRWMNLLWLTFARHESYDNYVREIREVTRKFLRACGHEIASDGEETLRPVLLSLFVDSGDEYRNFLPETFAVKDNP